MTSNRLIKEKSPYLLQHAHNPVNWHPWDDRAFQKAEQEDKPVFLSIGYATCHWCHVMAHESFEDQDTATHLNNAFICIKVDREERPDVDALYMAACHIFNGNGGWPLNVFLTPRKQPFFAATYIPKTSGFGRIGLADLCQRVKQLWEKDRGMILRTAESITTQLGSAFSSSPADDIGPDVLNHAYKAIEALFDPESGGFDTAPKFPTPHRLRFLFRFYRRTGNQKALDMANHTLDAMRLGGIYDHVGFGFHRYATDAKWLLPHFEKMLYDQALLATAYMEAYQTTNSPGYAATAREIFEYVLREMTDNDGGFFTAQDADSEGEEGKFYVWPSTEFHQVLGTEDGHRFATRFHLSPDGNFRDEATKQLTGANILYLTAPFSNDDTVLQKRWAAARKKLFQARTLRVPPLKDDKILTDWNGMMISAFAMGARLFDSESYETAAVSATRFILTRLRSDDGRLLHRFRDGEAAFNALADDYAHFIHGLLTLYRTTFALEFLETAIELQKQMIADFWDDVDGGFYLNASRNIDLPARPKEAYDNAIPCANSVALSNLLALAQITGDLAWQERATDLTRSFSSQVTSQPQGFTGFLMGLDLLLNGGMSVVLASPDTRTDAHKMLQRLNKTFLPHTQVLLKTPHNAAHLAELTPFTCEMKPLNGQTTAYVCKNGSCTASTIDAGTMMTALADG